MEGTPIRKKSIVGINLPDVPQIPSQQSESPSTSSPKKLQSSSPKSTQNNESIFSSLYGFKDREASFYKALNENIKMFDNSDMSQSAEMSDDQQQQTSNSKQACEEECREYIMPLMNRTQGSISCLLATKDSLDQLDSLHRIIQQLLTVQEQNYQMRKRLRTVKTLQILKEMEIQVSYFSLLFK